MSLLEREKVSIVGINEDHKAFDDDDRKMFWLPRVRELPVCLASLGSCVDFFVHNRNFNLKTYNCEEIELVALARCKRFFVTHNWTSEQAACVHCEIFLLTRNSVHI